MDDRVRSLERRVDVLKEVVDRHEAWVEKESKPFHEDMREFKTIYETNQKLMREEQSKRHKANSRKLNASLWLLALLNTLAAYLAIYLHH